MHSSEPPPLALGEIAVQMAIITALVLANAFFVAAEFALVSVRRTRIDQLAAEGSPSAVLLQRALHDLDRQIGAAQVGITVVSLVLGSTGEKYLEPIFARLLFNIHVPQALLGLSRVALALGLAYLIMTALHVIIGEQLPKIIAIQKAETVGLLIVRPMMGFTLLCTPLVSILTGSVNFFLRCLGIKAVDEHGQVHSPEELDLLFTQSHEGGELTQTERDILHRVVKFSEISARAVMVPRVEMKALPIEMTREALTQYLHETPHTRVPVYHGSLDDVIGIAHLKDLVRLEAALYQRTISDERTAVALNGEAAADFRKHVADSDAQNIHLMPIVREAARVPETITIDKLLAEFKKRGQQMAIVIDEYGGTAGLITMGDLLEQVFGDVRDEFDKSDPEIVERADGSIVLRGRVLIDEINDRYGLGLISQDADTIAGLVLTALGRPAEVGDEIEIHGTRLRVEEIDRLRITSLQMILPTTGGADDAARSVAAVAAERADI